MNTLYNTPRTCYDLKMMNTFNTSNEYNIYCPSCDRKVISCPHLNKLHCLHLRHFPTEVISSQGVGNSSTNTVTYSNLSRRNQCNQCK